MTRDTTMIFRIPDRIKAASRKAAEAEGRTLSGWLLWTVLTRLADLGYLKLPPTPPKRPRRR
jgi:hypothetical protein